LVNGRQYVVISGEGTACLAYGDYVIAYALPTRRPKIDMDGKMIAPDAGSLRQSAPH
jgi:hypothetical protein